LECKTRNISAAFCLAEALSMAFSRSNSMPISVKAGVFATVVEVSD
jgi:hypothetical protein